MEKSRQGMIGIYAVIDRTTGKKYIGASPSMNNAYKNHMNLLKMNAHKNQSLQNTWNLKGPEQLSFMILEMTDDKYSLPLLEAHWLKSTNAESIDNHNPDQLNLLQRSPRLATTKATIDELKSLDRGTIILTIRFLIDYYKNNS